MTELNIPETLAISASLRLVEGLVGVTNALPLVRTVTTLRRDFSSDNFAIYRVDYSLKMIVLGKNVSDENIKAYVLLGLGNSEAKWAAKGGTVIDAPGRESLESWVHDLAAESEGEQRLFYSKFYHHSYRKFERSENLSPMKILLEMAKRQNA